MTEPSFVPIAPLLPSTRPAVQLSAWKVCPLRHARTSYAPKRHRKVTPTARDSWGAKLEPTLYDALHLVEPMKDIDWNDFDFEQLKGKVVLAINVACQDDFTHSNYTMMQNMIEEYGKSGFVVLAFPSNWFGQKETWSNEKIKTFVHEGYTSEIMLMDKFDYEMNPVFGLGKRYFPGEIFWNFHGKFIFNRDGLPVARFDLSTPVEAISDKIREAIHGSPQPPDLASLEDDDDDEDDEEYPEYDEIPSAPASTLSSN